MPVTVQICPLCNSHDNNAFDTRPFRGQQVTNQICSNCGLVYQSPRMSEEELAGFYAQEYRLLYQGSEGPVSKDLVVQAARAEAFIAFIKHKVPIIARHLDIGCSAGLLLQHIQSAYNCQSVGIEPGTAYRQHAQANGLNVFASIQELLQSSEWSQAAPFDLISMAHVLEHLPDPIRYLSDLRQQLLAENGWLLVEVPNLYGHDCFEAAHMVSYSPHTLAQVLQQARYEIHLQEAHGRPRSQSIALYITALSTVAAGINQQTSPHVPIPEYGVRRKRRTAMLRRKLVTRLFPKRAWLPVES
jgi:trans-aconitate methyltransferase